MSSQSITYPHPVVDFAQRLTGRLDALTEAPLWSLAPADKRHALVTLARAEAQLASLRLRLLADAEESGATTETGAGSAADWLAAATRQVRSEARADLHLATGLTQHRLVAAALATGQANPAQARAILTALDRLPTSGEFAVTDQQRHQAEAHLVALAGEHDATTLRVLGRWIFEVIAPDLAEKFEGRALEREEAAALRRTTLTMREDDEGTTHGRFRIPAAQGQMLTKMILALANPARATRTSTGTGRDGAGGGEELLPTAVRHGLAFCQLIETVPAARLPKTGGCSATVVVTMTLEQLLDRLDTAGACPLDTGGRISAAQARRLACTAGIIPAVLGSRSQVLDLGRKSRSYTEAQRTALMLTQGGCTTTGCPAPASLCHAHHDRPWSHGGTTDLRFGRLLCPHHHRRLHDPTYHHTRLPDGTLHFHRRE